MALLLHELKEKLLSEYDVNTIVELLEITSEEVLEAFSDRVDERYLYLLEQIDETEEDRGETT